MKSFASIELRRVVSELKEKLIGGKINKVYVDFDRVGQTKKEVFIECHTPGKGKNMLRIMLPHILFITEVKPLMPNKPDGYCQYLRKYITNARIKDVEQMGAERIIRITLDARERTPEAKPVVYFMYIELFSKGNIILTNEDNSIRSPLETQHWSERTIRAKEMYSFPKKANVYKMTQADFAKMLELSDKDSIVTILAIDCSLGGMYAEEVCYRANVDKKTKKATKEEVKVLYQKMQELVKEVQEGKSIVIKKENKAIDVIPCSLVKYNEDVYKKEEAESFFHGIDAVFAPEVHKAPQQTEHKKQSTAVDKVKLMIKMQEKQIKKCEEDYEKFQEKGEMIYQHYKRIEDILGQLEQVRKTKSWKEIKKAAKEHKVIKQINEKNKEIILDLSQ